MIEEGKISIYLGPNARIESNRISLVPKLLIGRSADEALALFPMVYTLCAQAHIAAAQLALGRGKADTRMVLVENAREHFLRILFGWNTGSTPILPAAQIMALVDYMTKEIGLSGASNVANRLEEFLALHVYGCSAAEFLNHDSLTWLENAETGVAKYLTGMLDKGWQSLGIVQPVLLPDLPPASVAEKMLKPGFCDTPTWQGQPCETGSFARQSAHLSVTAIVRKHGNGLLARLMARLVDLAQIPDQIRAAEPLEMASGLGVVETARGRLIHLASIEDGVITDYRILAPTEWNFHPNGVAARALAGLTVEQARVVIDAIDPCVEFEIKAA